MNIYYVYELIDPLTNKPFYIGKGKEKRAWTHNTFTSRTNNPYKDRKIKKIQKNGYQPIVNLVSCNLSEENAYNLEEQLIKNIGIDHLTNICLGSKPPKCIGNKNGFYKKTHTKENKILCGNSNRGKDTKTAEGKESISNSMKNKWQDQEFRDKQTQMLKNRKGEKRSKEAIVSYKEAARKRYELTTPEERSNRAKKAAQTRKEKFKGYGRKSYIDEFGNKRFKWVLKENLHKDA